MSSSTTKGGNGTVRWPVRVLGAPFDELAAHLGDRLQDLDGALGRIEPPAAQTDELTDAEAAVGGGQHERSVAVPDGVGERCHLTGVEVVHGLALDLRQWTRSHGLATSRPASTAMRMTFDMICAAFSTVAGARPCCESCTTQRRTRM